MTLGMMCHGQKHLLPLLYDGLQLFMEYINSLYYLIIEK